MTADTTPPNADRPAALITGASRGIGRAIALALAARGWDIGINCRDNVAAAGETLAEVERRGGRGVICPGDISRAAARREVLDAFRAGFGRIDALVNNAGMAPRARVDILDLGEADWAEVLATNLEGPFFLTRDAARWMLEERARHPERRLAIVNLSSISEYAVTTARAPYCIAKAGIGMMTRLWAARLAEAGILVNEIRPGVIATDMTAGVKEQYDRRIAEGLAPIRRWGQPDDVARAVAALLGGDFPYTTGAAFDVDGGFHMRVL